MTSPNFSLIGKTAVITGASRGIGKVIALTYATAGANVVLASRKQAGVDAVAAQIEAAGGKALPIATHTANQKPCKPLLNAPWKLLAAWILW